MAIPQERRAAPPEPLRETGKSLCFSAYVYGNYQDYIPLFVCSTLMSYPEAHVRIFLRERLDAQNRKALEEIRSRVSTRFDIREQYFDQIQSENSVLLKTLRWLIPPAEYEEFDCVYVSDVDFLILREDPAMLACHLGYCRTNDLPYSNAVRVKNPPVKKLSGLHFFEVKPYFEAMGNVLEAELQAVLNGERLYQGISSNEFILYDLVERGIGRFPPLFYRPQHGIHLGYARSGEISAEMIEPWRGKFLEQMFRHPAYRALKPLLKRHQRRELDRVEYLATGQWWRRWRFL